MPLAATCCGFAGDRGMLHPELPLAATADEAAELGERDFDAHICSNRTCEIGLQQGTGRAYESLVFTLEELSRPGGPRMRRRKSRRGTEFRALHEGEPFVIPNPWDVGSAKVLAGLGFAALATTSSGFAYALGRHDGGPGLDQVIEHTAALAEATELPLSVDLENGHGPEPADAGDGDRPGGRGGRGRRLDRGLRPRARGSTSSSGPPSGSPRRSRRRARSASSSRSPREPRTTSAATPTSTTRSPACRPTSGAGADVLYAPGLRTVEEIRAVSEATSRPLNVLARPKLTMAEIADAGGTRVSLGGSLTFVAVAAMTAAAERIRDHGRLLRDRGQAPGRLRRLARLRRGRFVAGRVADCATQAAWQ